MLSNKDSLIASFPCAFLRQQSAWGYWAQSSLVSPLQLPHGTHMGDTIFSQSLLTAISKDHDHLQTAQAAPSWVHRQLVIGPLIPVRFNEENPDPSPQYE